MLFGRVDSKPARLVRLPDPLRLENASPESIPAWMALIQRFENVGAERDRACRFERLDAERRRLAGEHRFIDRRPSPFHIESAHELSPIAVVVHANES